MARTRIAFVQIDAWAEPGLKPGREYAVEERTWREARTLGRVQGSGRYWIALGVGAPRWVGPTTTRAAAVAAMRALTGA